MATPAVSGSISHLLGSVLIEMYKRAVSDAVLDDQLTAARNAFSPHALAICPMAVMAYEALFHESIFSSLTVSGSTVATIRRHAKLLSKLGLVQKSLLIPELVVGKTFERDRQPFSDFVNLVKIRNALVHFRMDDAPIGVVAHLVDRGFAYPAKHDGAYLTWTQQISTLEVGRWAINSAGAMATELTTILGRPLWLTGITDPEADKIIGDAQR